MLGSPSFHSYRDANSGTGKPNVELLSGIYYEDQAYSMGQSLATKAPVRRALIPAKKSNSSQSRDTFSSSIGPSRCSSNDVDDRIHNALLEELCADYGVTDSSYIDFLSFDIPTDRAEGNQLPVSFDELGEMVSLGTVRPKAEFICSVSESIQRTNTSSSQVQRLGTGVTTVMTKSEIRRKIPDDVASPTISSSCEESKFVEGGGEGLSDILPAVHSTTGSVSVKPEVVGTSGSSEDRSQQPANKSESTAEDNHKRILTPFTRVPDEQSSAAVCLSEDQQDGDDSTTSSPWHVTKKARLIASGDDLLEDVKKSYAFVCGANMFAPPTRLAVSHPRLHTPVGSKFQQVPYPQNVPGMRASFRDGYEITFQDGMQNFGNNPQLVSDKSYGASSSQFVSFDSSTPVKGSSQHYCNEWQSSVSIKRPYQTNVMRHRAMTGSGAAEYRPNAWQIAQGNCNSTGTGSDIRGPLPFTDGVQCPRATGFPDHGDQSHLNYQAVNCSSRPVVNQCIRSYGSAMGPCAPSNEHVGLRQNEHYQSPVASPYRSFPLQGSIAPPQRGMLTADESGNMYPTGNYYPASHAPVANLDSARFNEHVNRSSAESPVGYQGRPVTPSYSLQTGINTYMPESSSSSSLPYPCRESVTPSGQSNICMQPAPRASGMQTNTGFPAIPTQNQFRSHHVNTGIDPYVDRHRDFPRSPASNRSVISQMTPRRAFVPQDADQQYNSLPPGQASDNGCLGFVRHLIGSGSGPYRSHPLFPLLRDLVIADMNFEEPSFPYPLIAGLPRSFDRLISNYFSCTTHGANNVSIDPSVDAVVMDALRYAHSALLDKICQRQLKEGHQSDVPVIPVDSVCGKMSQIGPRSDRESMQGSWTDLSQNSGITSQCVPGHPVGYTPNIDTIPPSQQYLPSQFQAIEDSPDSRPRYTLLSSPSTGYHGGPRSSYLTSFGYGDIPMGMEKASRSKVLPNEAKAIMTEWLRNHQDNPYPNDDEKEELMQSTKLTINQINYWFTNARRRLLPKWSMIRRNAEEAKTSCGSPVMTP